MVVKSSKPDRFLPGSCSPEMFENRATKYEVVHFLGFPKLLQKLQSGISADSMLKKAHIAVKVTTYKFNQLLSRGVLFPTAEREAYTSRGWTSTELESLGERGFEV